MSLSTTRKHSSRMRIAHFGGHHYMSVLGGKYLVYVPSRIPTPWVYLPQDTFLQYAYPQIPTSLGILDIYPLPWVYLTPWIPTPSPMGIPNPLDTYPLSHGIPTCPGYYPRIPSPKCTYPWVYIHPIYLPLGLSTPRIPISWVYLTPWIPTPSPGYAYPLDTWIYLTPWIPTPSPHTYPLGLPTLLDI